MSNTPSQAPQSTTLFTTVFGSAGLTSTASSTESEPTAASSTSAPSTSSTQSSTAVVTTSSTPNAGTIAGCVVGGVAFLVVAVLAVFLYLRARKRKRTPPSSEFMNSIRAGAAPVLRLDSGVEYTPTIPEKGVGYTHPLMQNAYYTSPPMLDMKIPDETMMIDIPSARPSVEKPLHPQRFSSQQTSDSFHHPGTSVGSRRELWGSDADIVELSPVRRSPAAADPVLQFAPRFSLDEPSHLSHSPPSLHPLRRQPDPEGT